MSAPARQESAVAAAVAAARTLGLVVEEPRVLYDVFSVVVHLAPSPVVARVPTVLGRTVLADRSAQLRQMRLELQATAWLAGTGFPCVRPAHPEPLQAGGHALTLWELVEQLPDPVTEAESGAVVARLHAALATCPVDLDWLVPLDPSVPDGIVQLADTRPGYVTADDVERALAEWAVLEPWATDPTVHAAVFPDVPVQPVHGDAPFYNVIVTADGVLSSDFEHVGLGPDTLFGDHVGLHTNSSIYVATRQAALEAGRTLRLRIHVTGLDAMCRMIENGLGIGVMPGHAFELMRAGIGHRLRSIPLTDDWARREIRLVARDFSTLPVAARTLVTHLRASGDAAALEPVALAA